MAAEESWPLTFDKATKYSTILRRLNGSCPTITTYNTRWWLNNTLWPIFSIIYIYVSLYTIIYFDIRYEKYASAIRNGVMTIVGITITFKHLALLRYRKSLFDLIKIIDRDYEIAKDLGEDEKKIVLKYSEMGTLVSKIWLVVAILTASMFPVRAIATMGYYYYYKGEFKLVPVMELSYPFIDEYKNDPIVFCVLFALCSSFAMYACTIYAGFDPFIPIVMTHSCGQLELMSNKLLRIFAPGRSSQDINEDLKQINIKLMEIYSVVDTVQNSFVVLYEFVMKSTTFLVPFSVYQIVEGIKRREIPAEFTSFFIGSITHFYIPCYFSDLLMEKGESLRLAVYSSVWEMHPNLKSRKTILIMLTRTTKPLLIRTVFMPICLDTFAEMARQAYTIYNLMNAAFV